MPPHRPQRHVARLPHYDYTQPGAYFITIVTADRICLFDEPGLRCLAESAWLGMPQRLTFVELDSWALMPNHLHAIIWIKWNRPDTSLSSTPTVSQNDPAAPTRLLRAGSLGAIITSYKSASAQRINAWRHSRGKAVWQRNYYEHVVRDDRDLDRIRRYIAENPLRWIEDEYNPVR